MNHTRTLVSLLILMPLMMLAKPQVPVSHEDYLRVMSKFDSLQQIVYQDTVFDIVPEVHYESLLDSLLDNVRDVKQVMSAAPLPLSFFTPIVYTNYMIETDADRRDAFEPDYTGDPEMVWIEDAMALDRKMRRMRQYVYINDPQAVRYNLRTLPNPPREFTAVVNQEEHTIQILETGPSGAPTLVTSPHQGLIHWLHEFNGSMQFSQAYVSPNWYQGGNNNVNMIGNVKYNLKLNQKLHPTLLFETTVQYKLAMNSAPEDSIRGYNISEDLFQINSTFGLKAFDKFYYTVNMQFKTQLLNSYTSNTRNLRSAFLSPGELNAGIGMTYNTVNKKKTVKLDISLSPLSYNLMICTSDRINHASFKIDPDKNTSSKFGSTVECKLAWNISPNIKLSSRLFAFTDYSRLYADLENTVAFEINRFLTTQLFCHLRYDTNTPTVDPGWHKLQVKEILSLGFAYKFSTL